MKVIGKTRTNQPVEKTAGLDEEIVSQATEVIESGLVDNAKPIYCHPITLTNSNSTNYQGRFNALIFNNSSTAFTKQSLTDLLTSATAFRLVLTGGCKDIANSKVVIASHAYYDGTHVYVMGIDTSGNVVGVADNIYFEDFVNDSNTGFADNVNLIN